MPGRSNPTRGAQSTSRMRADCQVGTTSQVNGTYPSASPPPLQVSPRLPSSHLDPPPPPPPSSFRSLPYSSSFSSRFAGLIWRWALSRDLARPMCCSSFGTIDLLKTLLRTYQNLGICPANRPRLRSSTFEPPRLPFYLSTSLGLHGDFRQWIPDSFCSAGSTRLAPSFTIWPFTSDAEAAVFLQRFVRRSGYENEEDFTESACRIFVVLAEHTGFRQYSWQECSCSKSCQVNSS